MRVSLIVISFSKMCDMYGRILNWRSDSFPSVYAYIPHDMHRRLADALVYMSLMYGTRGHCTALDIHIRIDRRISVIFCCDCALFCNDNVLKDVIPLIRRTFEWKRVHHLCEC